MPGGCCSAFAGGSVLTGWGETKEQLLWCCRASSDNETVPPRHAGVMLDGLEKLSMFAGGPVLIDWDWRFVFLFWCCEASSNSESVCAGGAIPWHFTEVMLLWGVGKELLTDVGLRFECSWIKSANDGLPLGSAIVGLTLIPIPIACWLLWSTELRLPNPGGTGREELAVVILGLFSDRLLSGTERREGAELGEAEDMFKDASVPNERLFRLEILDGDELAPMLTALNEGIPRPRPASTTPDTLLFCTCSDMSCARLVLPTSGLTFWRLEFGFSELPETGSAFWCDKRSRKFSALACTSGWAGCVLDVMSVWEANKQAPYLTEANRRFRRGIKGGPRKRHPLNHTINKKKEQKEGTLLNICICKQY